MIKKIVKPNVLVLTLNQGFGCSDGCSVGPAEQRRGSAARGDSSVFDQSTDL